MFLAPFCASCLFSLCYKVNEHRLGGAIPNISPMLHRKPSMQIQSRRVNTITLLFLTISQSFDSTLRITPASIDMNLRYCLKVDWTGFIAVALLVALHTWGE